MLVLMRYFAIGFTKQTIAQTGFIQESLQW